MRCAVLLCVMLAGCAPMGERECQTTDWARLGERDGLLGGRPRIDTYAFQCGRHNVRAVEKDYLDGWWIGNAEFGRRTETHESGM